MVALIIIGSILAYCVGIGVTWSLLPDDMKDAGEPIDVLAALAWPLALAVMCGNWLVERIRERRTALPKATARKGAK